MVLNRFNKIALITFIAAQAIAVTAQGYPQVYSSSATYTEGDVVRMGMNWFRSLTTNTNKNPTNNTGSWELCRLRTNNLVSPPVYRIYVGVGHSFTNLYSAWNYVANAVIDKGAALQLYIDTTHGFLNENFSGSLNLDQAFGSQIQIYGDNVQNISLKFEQSGPGVNGITIDGGHSFGLIENVQLYATGAMNGTGISVDDGSRVNLEDVTMNNFLTGLSANHASQVHCLLTQANTSISMDGFTTGIIALDSSYISCQYAYVLGNGPNSTNGIRADQHSEIDATGAFVSTTAQPFYSGAGSTLLAAGSSLGATSNPNAYVATERGYINAANVSSATFYASNGGFINATGSTSSNYSTDSNTGSCVIP